MTKMLSDTQYVHLMMLKSFNIYELDYKHIHFIVSADSFQRESSPTHASDWL